MGGKIGSTAAVGIARREEGASNIISAHCYLMSL
jgi:hypothetical protein